MSASQEEWWRRPGSPLTWQMPGPVLPLLVVAVLSIAVWGWSERRAPIAPAQPAMQAVPELLTLPGLPGKEPAAQAEEIAGDEARKLNAAIPFAPTAGVPARPFRFTGSPADWTRAVDCLAIAAMSEAGGDDAGQRAVIQVVLNRVLHPGFAKTICGVVFQGSHRATGCQFTFTCDGALARRYSTASWTDARSRATEALAGWVHAPVGLATHYHTDWVHPYWSDSLIKLARVGTHLFFRWSGGWGKAAAFSAPYRGGEPAIAQIAYLPSHGDAAEPPAAQLLAAQAPHEPALRDVVVRNADGGAFVLLSDLSSAASALEMGRDICLDRTSCKVFGWFDRSEIPAAYPVPSSARAQIGFSYFRDGQGGEIILYDCARFAEIAVDGCIPASMARRRATGAGPAASRLALAAQQIATGSSGIVAPITGEPDVAEAAGERR